MGRLRRNIKQEKILFDDKTFYIQDCFQYKGKWKEYFNNDNPIHIEIGCGKGNFIISKALINPNINFIAIDKFPTILYKVLNKTKNINIHNLKIINICASKLLEVFDKNEIDKIYLNFSDPWPKNSDINKRLTSIKFLNLFFNILKNGSLIEFKTDNKNLFDFTYKTIVSNKYKLIYFTEDLYSNLNEQEKLEEIKTEYEIKWINKNEKIKKIIFSK